MHTSANTHTCMMDKCAKCKETWTVCEIRTHICLKMTYHVQKALCYTPGSTGSMCLYPNTCKQTEAQTHTHKHTLMLLTHLHLHERSPVEAARCSRQCTPQTTPLRHGGHTPSYATFPQTFPPSLLPPFPLPHLSLFFSSPSPVLFFLSTPSQGVRSKPQPLG